MNIWACYFVGYFFAVVFASVPISLIVDKLWKPNLNDNDIRYSWTSKILGYIERSLYVASFQIGKPEFIGIWLALKVAGQWNRWSDKNTGRHIYNIFLIGNGLSIAYSITGAGLIYWCNDYLIYRCNDDLYLAIVVPISLVLATLILFYRIERYQHNQ